MFELIAARLTAERVRLERDLGRAIRLQGDHRWRRLHVVSQGGFDASLADQVGWPASWRSAACQVAAEQGLELRPSSARSIYGACEACGGTMDVHRTRHSPGVVVDDVRCTVCGRSIS